MLAAAESWLLAEIRRRVPAAVRSVEGAPGRWSDAYLKRLLQTVPAIRVVWQGGAVRAESECTLNALWTVYVITGWVGGDERARRLGSDHQTGAWALVEVVAGWLHNALIPEVGRVRVARIDNHWTGQIDRAALAVYAIGLEIPIPIDPAGAGAALDEFLRAGIGVDLDGDGTAETEDHVNIRA